MDLSSAASEIENLDQIEQKQNIIKADSKDTTKNVSDGVTDADNGKSENVHENLINGCADLQLNTQQVSPDFSEATVLFTDSRKDASLVKTDKDDYDTHSDSIEMLEDDSSHDESQQKFNDSFLQQICLTPNHFVEKDRYSTLMDCSASPGADGGSEDARFNDAHESGAASASTVLRPESLSLPRSLQYVERHRSVSESHNGASVGDVLSSNARGQIREGSSAGKQRSRSEAIDIQGVKVRGDLGHGDDILSKSLPQGTITRKGELIEFVADDLQEKIKRSSPMASRADSGSMGSRRSSERSLASTSSITSASTSMATSSGVSRSPSSLLTQSPDAAPPIDPTAIMELEMCARRVADNVDHMMGNIRSNLHKMSAITVGCLEAYKTSVDITCDSVDSSIKSMYALMAKCEELSKTMQPVHQIGGQIKEIKRLLDLFEAQLADKP